MTLSGNNDRHERREYAKDWRREKDQRRPWVLPLLIGLAVVFVTLAIVASVVFGMGPA